MAHDVPDALISLYRRTLEAMGGAALARAAAARLPAPFHGAASLRLLGLGKAAHTLARGALDALTPSSCSGLLVLQESALERAHATLPSTLALMVGSHPMPDERSLAAGRALLRATRESAPEEPALILVSGGGSSLATAPVEGLTFEALRATFEALLQSGVPIEEMNAARKRLCALKGGKLAAALGSKRAAAMVLCDIPSGDLASVAGGPTLAGPTPPFDHLCLATPIDLARAAAREAAPMETEVAARTFTGRVEELAERVAKAALRRRDDADAPGLFIISAEPTLHIPQGAGRGGRMQHLALLLAERLEGLPFRALCAGSDGRDGDTAHAGALVDGRTAARARALGINLRQAIARFDSAPACAALGAALPAFDSGTNLCDLILLERTPLERIDDT